MDPSQNQSTSNGVISIHEVYTLPVAKQRMGWTDSAFRAARRDGLRVLIAGKRRYVAGKDLLDYLEFATSR